MNKIGINFVASSQPLGTPKSDDEGDMPRVSAGHPEHEYTSSSCIDALFEFLKKRYENERPANSAPATKKMESDEL